MLSIQECYEILGVTPADSPQAVRSAYLNLVKRWHPDRQSDSLSSEGNAQAQFLRIQAAYEQIQANQASLSSNPVKVPLEKSKPAQSTSQNLTAEMLYESATELGQKRLYREAIAELSLAIRINPSFALAYQYRGHLNSLLGLEKQAEADLNKADLIKRLGDKVKGKTQAEIEILARGFRPAKSRSPLRTDSRRNSWKVSRNQLIVGATVVAIGGGLLHHISVNETEKNFPRPFNIDSQSIVN